MEQLHDLHFGEGKRWRHEPADPPGRPLEKSTFQKDGLVVHLFTSGKKGMDKAELIKRVEVSDPVWGRYVIDQDGISFLSKLGQGGRMASEADPERVRGLAERLKETFIDRAAAGENRHDNGAIHRELARKIMGLFRKK